MEKLLAVLIQSLKLLRQEPRLFLPKLVSTFLSSIVFLGFVSGWISVVQMLALLPFSAFISVFVSLMVASMVRDRGSEKLLRNGFYDALDSWKSVFLTSLAFMIASFVVAMPAAVGIAFYLTSGSFQILLVGSLLTLGLVVALGYVSYFLPITLLETKSFLSGFSGSLRSSQENSKTVLVLVVFSLALFGLAVYSSSYLEALGYVGFVVGRLLATTVNTYLFVISPSYYLEKELVS